MTLSTISSILSNKTGPAASIAAVSADPAATNEGGDGFSRMLDQLSSLSPGLPGAASVAAAAGQLPAIRQGFSVETGKILPGLPGEGDPEGEAGDNFTGESDLPGSEAEESPRAKPIDTGDILLAPIAPAIVLEMRIAPAGKAGERIELLSGEKPGFAPAAKANAMAQEAPGLVKANTDNRNPADQKQQGRIGLLPSEAIEPQPLPADRAQPVKTERPLAPLAAMPGLVRAQAMTADIALPAQAKPAQMDALAQLDAEAIRLIVPAEGAKGAARWFAIPTVPTAPVDEAQVAAAPAAATTAPAATLAAAVVATVAAPANASADGTAKVETANQTAQAAQGPARIDTATQSAGGESDAPAEREAERPAQMPRASAGFDQPRPETLVQTAATPRVAPDHNINQAAHAAAPRTIASNAFETVERIVDQLTAARDFDMSKTATVALAHREFGALKVTFEAAAGGLDVAIAADDRDAQRALVAAMQSDRAATRAAETVPQANSGAQTQTNTGTPNGGERSGQHGNAAFGGTDNGAQGDRSNNGAQRGREAQRGGSDAAPRQPHANDDALYA